MVGGVCWTSTKAGQPSKDPNLCTAEGKAFNTLKSAMSPTRHKRSRAAPTEAEDISLEPEQYQPQNAARRRRASGIEAPLLSGMSHFPEALQPGEAETEAAPRSPSPQDGQASGGAAASGSTGSGGEVAEPPSLFSLAMQLLQGSGVGTADAEEALHATTEHNGDAYRWAEEAQLWLAQADEDAAETHAMREAMHASLAEAEARRAAEVPVEELAEEELLQRFGESSVLGKLRAGPRSQSLFAPPLRHPLAKLLELERKCGKWYGTATTRPHFTTLGVECCAYLEQCSASSSGAARGAMVLDVLTKGADFVARKLEELQEAVFKMPQGDNDVPVIFRGEEGEVALGQAACVELLSDEDEEDS